MNEFMLIVIILTCIATGTSEVQKPEIYFTRVKSMEDCVKGSSLFPARTMLSRDKTRIIVGTVCTKATGTSEMEQYQNFSIEDMIQSKINKREY